MADRNMKNMQALDYKVSVLAGQVVIATSTTGVSSSSILGASVARTGTGAYRITLADAWPELLSANLTVQKTTAQDLVPQISAVNLASKQIDFVNLTGATATDPTTDAATVNVLLVFKNSTINP
jgi:hypothetical protein